jgi:hypothetical protein
MDGFCLIFSSVYGNRDKHEAKPTSSDRNQPHLQLEPTEKGKIATPSNRRKTEPPMRTCHSEPAKTEPPTRQVNGKFYSQKLWAEQGSNAHPITCTIHFICLDAHFILFVKKT